MSRWVRPNELRRSNGITQIVCYNGVPAYSIPAASGTAQIVLYHGVPTASDISQGVLGDCWLLSALALITERPELINRVLVSNTINPLGAYQIRLCVDGNWTVITIDDILPVDAFGNLIFAKVFWKKSWSLLRYLGKNLIFTKVFWKKFDLS